MQLGERLAKKENEFAQAQEKWRMADNNRMAEFFNPGFSNNQQDMNKGQISTGPVAAMAFNQTGMNQQMNDTQGTMIDRKVLNKKNDEI